MPCKEFSSSLQIMFHKIYYPFLIRAFHSHRKDGGDKARQRGTLKHASWFTLIEGMPMRRDEIRRQKKSRE